MGAYWLGVDATVERFLVRSTVRFDDTIYVAP